MAKRKKEVSPVFDDTKGTITSDGIFEFSDTPPAWVIEGIIGTLITDIEALVEVAHNGGTKRLSKEATVRAACVVAYTSLADLERNLTRVKDATLKPKHRSIKKVITPMVRALRTVGTAHEAAGVENNAAARDTAKTLVEVLTALHLLLDDKTSALDRAKIVKDVEQAYEVH